MSAEFANKLLAFKKLVYEIDIFPIVAYQLTKAIGYDFKAIESYLIESSRGNGSLYLKDIYKAVIAEHEDILTRYFDKLFELLSLLEEAYDKTNLVNVLANQLTNDEKLLILYHGISNFHTNKFIRLVDSFQLLKEMSVENKILELHKGFYPQTQFVYHYFNENAGFD